MNFQTFAKTQIQKCKTKQYLQYSTKQKKSKQNKMKHPIYSLHKLKPIAHQLTFQLSCERNTHKQQFNDKSITVYFIRIIAYTNVWRDLLFFLLTLSGSWMEQLTLMMRASPFSKPPAFFSSSSSRFVSRNGPTCQHTFYLYIIVHNRPETQ